MNIKSRTQNSLKNISTGIMVQIISIIANFVVRYIFIKYLNEEYLGISGLFTNILSVLSLVDLGFGSALVYSMYKPLAEKNNKKLQAIMNLYRRVYIYIGILVGIIGLAIIPFMDYIITDKPNINNLILIYIMYLLNSVSSYFIAYKRSILSADQKEYISSHYRYIFIMIRSIVQISVLTIFKSFILYLFVQIICTILENVVISKKVDEIYPFLKEKNNEKLSKIELKKIKDDVKALIISKFGSVMVNSTDNIIISSFVGIRWVGLISNYDLIVGAIDMLLSQIINGLTGSIGNFMTEKNQEEKYNLYRQIDFLNFWLYGFCCISLTILLNPFIELWIGSDYLIKQSTINVLSINFFINGVISMIWMFRSTTGLFTKGKYRPVLSAVLNIVISIILGKYMGLIGVLLGTTISRILSNLCFDPYIIYKYAFGEKVKQFYISYMFRSILMIFMYISLNVIKCKMFIDGVTILGFVLLLILSIVLINFVLYITYKKSEEFKYILNIGKLTFTRINKKYILD